MQERADFAAFASEDLRASPEERRRWLLDRLRRDGRLVAAALARELDTSEDTIRRDLRELAAAGMVQRVHGGALPNSPALSPFSARRGRFTEAKERLAAEAVKLVRPDQVMLLDGGTTNLGVRPAAPANAPAHRSHPQSGHCRGAGRASRCGRPIVLGGLRRQGKPIGRKCCRAGGCAGRFEVDVCFLGVCSLAAEVGVSVAGYEEAELKRVYGLPTRATLRLIRDGGQAWDCGAVRRRAGRNPAPGSSPSGTRRNMRWTRSRPAVSGCIVSDCGVYRTVTAPPSARALLSRAPRHRRRVPGQRRRVRQLGATDSPGSGAAGVSVLPSLGGALLAHRGRVRWSSMLLRGRRDC